MEIKVKIEVDGTLLTRLEDERHNVSQDAVSTIANIAREEAAEQAVAHRDAVGAEREKEAAKAAKAAEKA